LLNPAACEVMLCHVIRPLSVQQLGSNDLFLSKKEADWISVNQQKIVPKIVDAKRHLMAHGFTADHISSEILTYQTSRAGAIAQAAATGSFDTIVLGRRGFTSVEAFKIGRVCRKIIHFAYRPALWIVN
jgi:nucleotide-binding universal stress UspA family protein